MGEKQYTEEEIAKAQSRVERLAKLLRINLRRKLPYYGLIVTKLTDIYFTDQIDTAATDGINILVNPAFMVDKLDKEINFVLMHEILHVVFRHRLRFESDKRLYLPSLWNVACDYMINFELASQQTELEAAGVSISILESCLLLKDEITGKMVDLSDKTAEKLYMELLDKCDDNSGCGNNNGEADSEDGSGNSSSSDTDSQTNSNNPLGSSAETKEISEETIRSIFGEDVMSGDVTDEIPIEAQKGSKTSVQQKNHAVKAVLKEVAQKGYSINSTSLDRAFQASLETTKIRWDIYLRKFLSSQITDETTYDKPNRKYLPYELIMPGSGGTEECLTDVFLFIDTSGSIGDVELLKALNNAYTLSHDYRATLSLAFWDTKVSQVIEDIQPDEIKTAIKSINFTTGGTDISCVLDYIKTKKLQSAAFVVFTDGCFDIPQITSRIRRKMILALENTKNYAKGLDTLGKVVSINEKECFL